jgi:hypothetical protein
MLRLGPLALLLPLTAAACSPTLGVRGQLTIRARDEMHCPDVERVLQLTEDAFEVDGCQRMVEYADAAPGPERDWVRLLPAVRLAARDTGCSLEQLSEATVESPTRRTFSGCGATASYALECGVADGCRWNREGDVVRAPPPPGPAVITPVSTPTATDTIPPPPGAP